MKICLSKKTKKDLVVLFQRGFYYYGEASLMYIMSSMFTGDGNGDDGSSGGNKGDDGL